MWEGMRESREQVYYCTSRQGWRSPIWWFNFFYRVPEKFVCWELRGIEVRGCLRKIMRLWNSSCERMGGGLSCSTKIIKWCQCSTWPRKSGLHGGTNFVIFFFSSCALWLAYSSKGSRRWGFSKLGRSSRVCHGRTGKSGSRMFIVEWLRLHTVVFKRFRV